MPRRALLVGALVLAGLAAAVLVALTRKVDAECPVPLEPVPQEQPALVELAELVPTGSVGATRKPVVQAAGALGAPFGEVVSGRFYDEGVPVIVPFGERTMLASASGSGGLFQAVALPDGEVDWARRYDAGAARGGLVGDAFVVLLGGADPSLLALASDDGAVLGCRAVPAEGAVTTVLTDQADADVVTAVGSAAGPVTLARLEPQAAELRWERRLEEVTEAGSVTVVGPSVVVSRLAADPVRRAEMAAAGGITAPMLTAYSLDDGAPTWQYPSSPDRATTAVSVVDGDASADLLTVLASQGAGRFPERSTVRLVALDPTGSEVWSAPLGRGFWGAELWGAHVVAQGPDPRGGAVLRSFSLATGEPEWEISTADLRPLPDGARRNFGSAVEVGERFVVPAPNGLLVVDPRTGSARQLDSEVPIEQVVPAGDHALVRTEDAVLVVELDVGPGV